MREMKDSGIEWIGEIPTNWHCIRGKYILTYMQKPVRKDDEVITCFRDGEVTLRSNRREEGFTLSDKEIGYQGIDIGDLVVHGMDGFAGSIGISDSRGKASPVLNVLDSEQDKRYLMYYMRNMAYSNVFLNLSTGIRVRSCDLRWNKLAELPYLVPPLKIQQKLSNNLEKICKDSNMIVDAIKSQIDILEQYKQSVITEIVTKGLNTNVEMKDSGIEWIGEIPLNWETRKIGRLFILRNEKNYKPLNEVQLLSLYTDIGVFPHGEQEERGNKAVQAEGYKIVKKNDIVINILLAWMGAIGISNYDGVTSPAYDVYISDTRKVVPHYYHYVFRTTGIAGECYKYGRGIMLMRWRTYSSEFKQISVPFPPIDEQRAIADYLDDKCTKIDKIIEEKKKQIVTIEEYKKTLIFEYVTGKKEVGN